MVDVWLPYGSTEVCLRVPTRNFIGTLGSEEARGVENPRAEIENAIKNPVGARRLSELARPDMRVTIVVKNSTETDAQLNRMILEAVRKELAEACVESGNIKVLVAYDPMAPIRNVSVGAMATGDLLKGVEVMLHNPDGECCVEAGRTSSGRRLLLNRVFVEADLRVTVGFVELHPYAGYGGGREAILPGISDMGAIRSNLALAFNSKARMGVLDGNPVHEDMMEAARLVEIDFAVNVVRNSLGEVVGVFSGALDDSFRSGVKLLEDMYRVQVERKADIVFSSSGGNPHDRNLYRASIGVANTLDLLKRDGTLVLVAECLESYGDEAFYTAMRRFRRPESLEKDLKRNFTIGGYVAYRLMRAMKRVRMHLVSVLPDYYALEVFGFRTHRTVNEALRYALDEAGRNAKITAVTSGNTIVPLPSKEE